MSTARFVLLMLEPLGGYLIGLAATRAIRNLADALLVTAIALIPYLAVANLIYFKVIK